MASACGAADVLEALGVVIDLGPAGVLQQPAGRREDHGVEVVAVRDEGRDDVIVGRGIGHVHALDVHDPISGHFTLEVTSPGLERTLRTPPVIASASESFEPTCFSIAAE